MAKKLSKEFFLNNEALVLGYPLQDDMSMKLILKAFLDNGIRVLAMNAQATGDADVKLYKSFDELPHIPETAYIFLDKPDIDAWIEPMAAHGIRRVLFHSKKDVDPAQLAACQKTGMETAVACPMMLLGRGIHRLHAFLAGV